MEHLGMSLVCSTYVINLTNMLTISRFRYLLTYLFLSVSRAVEQSATESCYFAARPCCHSVSPFDRWRHCSGRRSKLSFEMSMTCLRLNNHSKLVRYTVVLYCLLKNDLWHCVWQLYEHFTLLLMASFFRSFGNVVVTNGVGHINKVELRRAVHGFSAGLTFRYSSRPTQPGHPSLGRRSEQ